MRLVLVIGLFLSSTSLASLSDRVFELRGFVLTGVEFYRTWIAGPIVALTNGRYSRVEVDLLSLIVLLLWPVSRVERKMGHTLGDWFVSIYGGLYFWILGVIDAESQPRLWQHFLMPVLMYASSGFLVVRKHRHLALTLFGPPLFVALLVASVAAVSEGLTRQRTSPSAAWSAGRPPGTDECAICASCRVKPPSRLVEPTLLFFSRADSNEVAKPGDPAAPLEYLAAMCPVADRGALGAMIGPIGPSRNIVPVLRPWSSVEQQRFCPL
jgi:hypothetical protein